MFAIAGMMIPANRTFCFHLMAGRTESIGLGDMRPDGTGLKLESSFLLLRFFRPLYLTRRNVVTGIEPSCRGATLHESSSPFISY